MPDKKQKLRYTKIAMKSGPSILAKNNNKNVIKS
jgi:hypothetical protein